jgi:hypothetical protein
MNFMAMNMLHSILDFNLKQAHIHTLLLNLFKSYKKYYVVHSASWVQLRSYLKEKVAAPV